MNLIRADHSPRCQSCLLPRLLLVLVLVRNLYFYILLWPHYGLLLIRPSSNKTSVIHPLRPPNRLLFCQLLKGSLHTGMEPLLLIKRGERKQHSGRREDGEEEEEEGGRADHGRPRIYHVSLRRAHVTRSHTRHILRLSHTHKGRTQKQTASSATVEGHINFNKAAHTHAHTQCVVLHKHSRESSRGEAKLWFIDVFIVKPLLWSICERVLNSRVSLSRKLAAEWDTADRRVWRGGREVERGGGGED